jgi:site-specific DNA-methyltransferase (adenine-specific)
MLQEDMKNKDIRIHPTQKPLKLFEMILRDYSKENDLILDCFSGSGTTAIACHNLNRRFICIEKDYDYWKASVERLENAKSQLNLFTNIEQPKEEIIEQAKLF